ncbi:MAG: carboxypeptidase regulatory-like domain-containing protein [Planctomycetia bacterium]|nr:carboxypeptidase regulatory-like domain-containing protein [Planctomycetia bacterium]
MDGRALLSRVLGGVFVLLLLAWGLSMLVGPRAGPPTSPDAPGLVGIGGPAPAPLAASPRDPSAPPRSAAAPRPGPTSEASAGDAADVARTVTLRGTVTDANGAAVEGADVAARPGLAVHVSTTSDATGRFSLEVPAGSTCRLRARHRRVGRVERAGLAVGGAGLDVGPIVLVPAGILEGTVELSDGSRVPWGLVWLGVEDLTGNQDDADPHQPTWAWPGDARVVGADRDGVFVARDLEPGAYALFCGVVGRPHLRALDSQTAAITDATGLRVLCLARVLVVSVRDEAGAPVARGTVRYVARDDAGGVTDAGTSEFRDGIGAIEVDGVSRLTVRAETDVSESGEVEVRIDAAGPVRIERALTVRPLGAPGHVRIEAKPSPTPIRQYFVRATELRVDGTPGIGGASFVVEAGTPSPPLRTGRWRLQVFPGGLLRRVSATDVHGGPPPGTIYPPPAAEIHEVLVPAGGEVTVQAADREAGFLRATLRNAAAFDGVTRDVVVRGRDPASEATWIGLWSVPGHPFRWRGLGADGPQEFSVPLAPGAYVLDVTMRGRGAASVPFEIRAGATTDVEVAIEPTPAQGR